MAPICMSSLAGIFLKVSMLNVNTNSDKSEDTRNVVYLAELAKAEVNDKASMIMEKRRM